MFEAMRVLIVLFLVALDSLGMERLQSVTWGNTVPAHTKKKLQIFTRDRTSAVFVSGHVYQNVSE